MPEFEFGTKLENPKWLVEPIFPLGQLGIILAQAGVGKSLIVEDLAVHVVCEVPFCGFNTNFGDVLIIDQDTNTDVLYNRLNKFNIALGKERKHRLIVESKMGYSLSDGTLITKIREYPTATLVIIDSMHSVCGKCNPNSTTDMNLWAKVKSQCIDGDRTILVNHHISEKQSLDIRQLMTENPHTMSMGSSVIIQQADSYYIIGASANDGVTNKIYIRPIAKRVSIRSTPLVLQMVFSDEGGERLEFSQDYITDLDEVEIDCLTLFKENPLEWYGTKEVFENIKQRHGINAVRKALNNLQRKGKLVLSRHKSNLFKYRLP